MCADDETRCVRGRVWPLYLASVAAAVTVIVVVNWLWLLLGMPPRRHAFDLASVAQAMVIYAAWYTADVPLHRARVRRRLRRARGLVSRGEPSSR